MPNATLQRMCNLLKSLETMNYEITRRAHTLLCRSPCETLWWSEPGKANLLSPNATIQMQC